MCSGNRHATPFQIVEIQPPLNSGLDESFEIHWNGPLDEASMELVGIAKKINLQAAGCTQSTFLNDIRDIEAKRRYLALKKKYLKDLRELASLLVPQEGRTKSFFEKELARFEGHYLPRLHELKNVSFANLIDRDGQIRLEISPPTEEFSETQIALFLALEHANSVVEIVTDKRNIKESSERKPKLPTWLNRKVPENENNDQLEQIGAIHGPDKQKLVYLKQLQSIANDSLGSESLSEFGLRKVQLFKEIFVSREADRVKNEYITQLGKWTLFFFLVFALLNVFFANGDYLVWKIPESKTEINLGVSWTILACGSCIGAWLSFSLRKVELRFEDLVLLEPDRLHPASRVIFVVLLTWLIGLFLELGWVTLVISDAKVTPAENWPTALLLGTICGISERSLSGLVSEKADGLLGSLSSTSGHT